MKNRKSKAIYAMMRAATLFFGFLLFNLSSLYSQTAQIKNSGDTLSQAAGVLVFVLVAVMFILIFVFSKDKYIYVPGTAPKTSLFRKFRHFVTRSVPIEQEADIMLDHDFDGIRELDNRVPPWFNFLFYGTIVFAAVYLLNYHVFGSGSTMIDEYLDEVRAANEKREELIKTGAFVNENNVTQLTDAASLQNGKNTFAGNCVPCHGPDGGGTVGPNLTDKYWIHGGGIKNVFTTIKYGVPVKGMISWQSILNPKKMQEVGSYVLSLQGSNPPTGKPPEGNLYADSTQTASDTTKIKTDSTKIKTDTTKTKK